MLMALEWIEERKQPEQHYAIFTDSLSLVTSIKAQDWKDNHEWLKRIKQKLDEMRSQVIICWVPSHCNTYGNDKEDEYADKGAK